MHSSQRPATSDPTLLSAADDAWRRMDRPRSRMVITVVMLTRRPVSCADVREQVVPRLLRYPRFSGPLRSPLEPTRPRASAPLDLDAHILSASLRPLDPSRGTLTEDLLRFVGDLMSRPLDAARPSWEVHVVERMGEGSALVWRLHHALADGMALLRVLLESVDVPVPLPRPRAPREVTRLAWVARASKALASLVRLALLPRDAPTRLRTPLSGTRKVAWTPPVSLDEVKALARRHGATVNDVLVSALAEGLHRALCQLEPTDGAEGRQVRALIPVDLREEGADASLGNRFGMVYLTLPVGPMAPVQRLARVKARMDRLKRSAEPYVAYAILRLLGRISPTLTSAGLWLFSRKASLVLTNVAGPQRPVTLAGAPVDRVLFWVPQAGDIGLGVSIFSYGGEVQVGVAADTALLPEPALLTEGFIEALATLQARTRADYAMARGSRGASE